MNIALIQCPWWSILVPPYSLALLSAYLRKEGHNVFCYDFNIKLYRHMESEGKLSSFTSTNWYDRDSVLRYIEDNNDYIEQLISEVLREDVQIIGFTIYDTTRWFSQEMASRILKKKSSIKIVFGGFSCFREDFAKELLRDCDIDAVCLKEGEIAFTNLVNIIENNKGKISFCPGFIYKEGDKIINCGKQNLIEDLDSLPYADFSDFDLSLYEKFGLPISTSRGCINRCFFCQESVLWGRYRKRQPLSVYKEISYQLEKYPQVDYFFFNDSLINGDMEMLNNLIDLIREGDLYFMWAGQAMIREEMDLEFLRKMRKVGFSSISYGLESASPKILKLIGKRFSPEIAERVIRDTKRAGIHVSVNIIVGFPGETWGDVTATSNFLKRNLEFIDEIYLDPLILSPDSPFYYMRDKFGIVILDIDPMRGWISDGGKNDFQARVEKIKFLEDSLGSKVHIPVLI
jgi:radical SAM superfamily enzyme YgiQ (UPF0313 family)